MNKEIFLRWLRINILFFVGAFVVSLFLGFLFPDVLLGFVRGWGARSIGVSSALLGNAASKDALFIKIFAWNGLMTVIFFMASLFLLAPLVAVIMGVFYSLGLMSAIERCAVPFWHSPILIAIEASFIILSITFASTLATEIFGVKPERKEIMDFWKKNWKRLFPEQKRSWRVVLTENKKELILFIVTISALLLFGAWFEALI